MWTGDAEAIFEVGEERDRLKSFAEALLRHFSSRNMELLKHVPDHALSAKTTSELVRRAETCTPTLMFTRLFKQPHFT
jgi:hypothetical protein